MVELQDMPLTRRSRGGGVARAAAHAAERRIDNELNPAVLAEVVSDGLFGDSVSDIYSSALAAGRRCFLPMLVVKHGFPVTAFSSQRMSAHGKKSLFKIFARQAPNLAHYASSALSVG
jgi:hypothetical protein